VENIGNLQLDFTTEGLPLVIGKKVAGIVEELNSDVISL
jgi:Zn-dependent alcohol dehydrogenase